MQLFIPIVPEERQHHNFRNLLQIGNVYTFDVLNDWARGFVDRDGKFVEEFQATFNSSFWELYLFAVLKKYGFSVDFSKSRPDFCLPDLDLNIEAAVASNPEHGKPEYRRAGVAVPADLNEFNRKSILRLSNSLSSKHRKYVSSYAALEHVRNCAFVLAVASFDQPFSFMAAQRPIEAVLLGYYVDEERYIRSGRRGGRLEGEELRRVFKDNGKSVELGLFTTPAYREISAVIFSSCATIGKVRALSADPNPRIVFTALRLNSKSDQPHVIRAPKSQYQENLLDGLRIYHNPFAAHPMDPALFRHPSVFQAFCLDGEPRADQRDGLLLYRSVHTEVPAGTLAKHRPHKVAKSKR